MGLDFTVILEAGVNHDGNLEKAFELIEQASTTGADFIKFQTYTSSRLAASNSPSYWDLSEEKTTSQKELFSRYDKFTVKNYFALAKRASQLNIGFMTTCFDKEWVDELDHILPQYKIASADITNFDLISHIASKGKPILLSTGGATFQEILSAVNLINSVGKIEVSLLHCVLNYPTSAENASLNRIRKLMEKFPDLKIGYSDHTKPSDSYLAINSAYAIGARIFEKHFTWNPNGVGNDHYHSFSANQVMQMIESLRTTQKLLPYDEDSFINCQLPARLYARRGIYAKRNLTKGHVLSNDDLIPLRPSIGESGFQGNEFFLLIGKKLKSNIKTGAPILRDSVE